MKPWGDITQGSTNRNKSVSVLLTISFKPYRTAKYDKGLIDVSTSELGAVGVLQVW